MMQLGSTRTNQILFSEDSKILQQYILENPEHLSHVNNYFKSIKFLLQVMINQLKIGISLHLFWICWTSFIWFLNYSLQSVHQFFLFMDWSMCSKSFYEELYENVTSHLQQIISMRPKENYLNFWTQFDLVLISELNYEQFELIKSKYSRRNVEELLYWFFAFLCPIKWTFS